MKRVAVRLNMIYGYGGWGEQEWTEGAGWVGGWVVM